MLRSYEKRGSERGSERGRRGGEKEVRGLGEGYKRDVRRSDRGGGGV